ncbi:MAG TPA: sigma-70 family RNA polymerase sigma factor [Phycisphaerales bacterium]|nr:sigma-70 family RNA polymerase sigma factor [Phycisphaerales bacterium]
MTTLDLVHQVNAGDPEALSALLRTHGPVIRDRLAPKIGRQWSGLVEADDVMQVTYLEAFVQFRRVSFKDEGSFAAWLARVAENNLKDAIRSFDRAKRPDPRRRVHGPANEESYAGLVEVLGVTTTTPSRAAARREAVTVMDQALAKLPADYAKVVRLYDLECRPIEEVSRELGRSPGACYMLRARAHDALREAMGTASQFFSVG